MDKEKLKEIFEELLELYESAESTVINDRSVCLDGSDWDQLQEQVKDFKERFYEALEV